MGVEALRPGRRRPCRVGDGREPFGAGGPAIGGEVARFLRDVFGVRADHRERGLQIVHERGDLVALPTFGVPARLE